MLIPLRFFSFFLFFCCLFHVLSPEVYTMYFPFSHLTPWAPAPRHFDSPCGNSVSLVEHYQDQSINEPGRSTAVAVVVDDVI